MAFSACFGTSENRVVINYLQIWQNFSWNCAGHCGGMWAIEPTIWKLVTRFSLASNHRCR